MVHFVDCSHEAEQIIAARHRRYAAVDYFTAPKSTLVAGSHKLRHTVPTKHLNLLEQDQFEPYTTAIFFIPSEPKAHRAMP
jgi:hypothetical protein